jgi:hypothetical protein
LPSNAALLILRNMALPSTKTSYGLLTGGYAAGLFLTYLFGESGWVHDLYAINTALVVWIPIGLTATLIVGQMLVMKRERAAAAAGRGSGTPLSHTWAVILVIYIIVTWLAFQAQNF